MEDAYVAMTPGILVFVLEAAWAIEAFVTMLSLQPGHLTLVTIEDPEVDQNDIDVHGAFSAAHA